MDQAIAAFDLETIPDAMLGRRLWGLAGSDAEVIAAMSDRRREESGGRTDMFQPPWHRIVALAVAWLDPQTGKFKLGSPAGRSLDEPAHLDGFFNLTKAGRSPLLVSWNGSDFDLPATVKAQ